MICLSQQPKTVVLSSLRQRTSIVFWRTPVEEHRLKLITFHHQQMDTVLLSITMNGCSIRVGSRFERLLGHVCTCQILMSLISSSYDGMFLLLTTMRSIFLHLMISTFFSLCFAKVLLKTLQFTFCACYQQSSIYLSTSNSSGRTSNSHTIALESRKCILINLHKIIFSFLIVPNAPIYSIYLFLVLWGKDATFFVLLFSINIFFLFHISIKRIPQRKHGKLFLHLSLYINSNITSSIGTFIIFKQAKINELTYLIYKNNNIRTF